VDEATILERVTGIRSALTEGDVAAAYLLVVSVQHALACGVDTLEYLQDDAEAAPASAVAATGVATPSNGLAERMRLPQYDTLVEEMSGPPRFHLVLAGEMEGPIESCFSHSVCSDGEYERLLEWLRRTPELGPLLDAALSGPPPRGG